MFCLQVSSALTLSHLRPYITHSGYSCMSKDLLSQKQKVEEHYLYRGILEFDCQMDIPPAISLGMCLMTCLLLLSTDCITSDICPCIVAEFCKCDAVIYSYPSCDLIYISLMMVHLFVGRSKDSSATSLKGTGPVSCMPFPGVRDRVYFPGTS